MPTNGFSIKPLKVKLLAGEQKATEFRPPAGQGSGGVWHDTGTETHAPEIQKSSQRILPFQGTYMYIKPVVYIYIYI